jgi:hypothetical protein
MANLYVTRATLNLSGSEISDFKAFSESAVTTAKQVQLMHKTGVAALTRRFLFTLTYVVPAVGVIDWETFVGSVGSGTCNIKYDNGDVVKFLGVSVLEVGEASVDGENELSRVISFMAERKNGAAE